MPTHGISFTAPLMCLLAISAICSRADLEPLQVVKQAFPRVQCALVVLLCIRLYRGPRHRARSVRALGGGRIEARFALSSKRTPTSLFSLTSVSGFLSVDAPEPIVSGHLPLLTTKRHPWVLSSWRALSPLQI